MKICSVEGCNNSHSAKGFCLKHYHRVRKYGSPDGSVRPRGSLEERFWRKVVKGEPGECWKWAGSKGRGYGQVQEGGRGSDKVLAHRLSYEIHKGHIPDGLLVLHECDNRECTNPDHLRVGTQSDNIRDAVKRGRWEDAAKRLPRFSGAGHPCAMGIDKAREIARSEGTLAELSRKFNVDPKIIKAIKNGTHWSCRQ